MYDPHPVAPEPRDYPGYLGHRVLPESGAVVIYFDTLENAETWRATQPGYVNPAFQSTKPDRAGQWGVRFDQ